MEKLLLYENISRFAYIKISQASILLPILGGLIFYNKLGRRFKLLFWFFVLSVFFELQATVAKKMFGNNMPGLHLYTVVEFIVFSTAFYWSFQKSKILSKMFYVNTFLFLTLAIIDATIINGIWAPNTVSRTYSSISLVSYSLVFFYQFFKNNMKHYSWEIPMFWIGVGVLVYFSLNIFYFMLNRYLIENTIYTAKLSLLSHAGINIISNILYAKSFLCFKKPQVI